MGKQNRAVLSQVIYRNGEFCWLNGTISRQNPLTAHHIKAVRNGGPTIPQNIAPLTDQRHKWFNRLEHYYPDLAEEVNRYMRAYEGCYPEEIEWRINQIFALVTPNNEHKEYKVKVKTKNKRHKHRR